MEKSLLDRLQTGDSSAFEVFVEQYKDRVYNTVLSILQNQEDAEDLSQEVFIDIWKKIPQFRGEAALSTWVYQICINRCRDHLKWKKRKKRFAWISSLYGEQQELKHDQADFVHPGVQLENREQAKIVLSAIKALPESQRLAFSMHKLEDLSYQEIAEIMGKSLSSIESVMHRAKKNLQKSLHDYYHKQSL